MPTFVISTPPSTNNLFVNMRTGGRRKSKAYTSWIRGELKALLSQRARPVPTPVKLTFEFPETMRGDLDGRLKAAIDLLVRSEIIPDDSRKYVRAITAGFGKRTQTAVSIETVEEKATC